MAAREPIKLVFGDETFKIRPLTFSQVTRLEQLFMTKAEPLSNTEMALQAITIALSRDHATVKVGELACDVQQVPAQLQAIMALGGFTQMGGASAAAGTNAPIGDLSGAA